MKEYSTIKIAQMFGIHSNTIRFYEKSGLLFKIERKENGYRFFTSKHIQQIKLIRIAFNSEILANNLRKQVVEILKTSAREEYDSAITLTLQYKCNLELEEQNAKDAIHITKKLLNHTSLENDEIIIKGRYHASKYLGISIDVLRDWQRNGLLKVFKDSKGHLLYGEYALKYAKIIRTLRCAHYSMISILRMLNALDSDIETDILEAIDTSHSDSVIYATDRFITTLKYAQKDVEDMLLILEDFKLNNMI